MYLPSEEKDVIQLYKRGLMKAGCSMLLPGFQRATLYSST